MSDGNGNGKVTTPEQAQKSFDEYLGYLTPEIRESVRNFATRQLVKHYKGDGSDAHLEPLLPGLRLTGFSEILKTEYPPICWIVPDFLPVGLTFLFGKPKIGKSWLALQLALAVLSGGKLFDKDVEKGDVLYAALEDNGRRLQGRMKKQGWPISAQGKVDFMFFNDFKEQIGSLNDLGGKRLLSFVETHQYRLIIVDTFSRSMQGDQLKADEMTAAIGPLQQSALARDIGLIIIDHEPKNGDSLFGSVAKQGIMDTSWRLWRSPGKHGAILDLQGRDVEEHSLKLVFDRQFFYWRCEGEAWEVAITERREEVLKALRMSGRCSLGDIVELTGQHKQHVHDRLQDLVNAGKVLRVEIGANVYYELPIDNQ